MASSESLKSLQQQLEAGLTALKEGDTLTALAYLAAVAEIQPDTTLGIRSRMGLVSAYEKHGQPDRALAIIQTLQGHPDERVKTWADRAWKDLVKRYPEVVPAQSVGSGEGESVPENRVGTTTKHQASPTSTTAIPANTGLVWRQAGRAKAGQVLLPKVKLTRLWLIEMGSIVALYWLVSQPFHLSIRSFNELLRVLPWLEPIPALAYNYSIPILIFGITLLGVSPWLMDWILRIFYGQQQLPTATLATYSPETIRHLNQETRKRKIPLPTLALLPTAAPVALTYGWLPRNARIVVSQGLLDRLSDDEIATLYAQQLGHILNWDFGAMTLMGLVQQLPYLVYWHAAKWSDRLQEQQSRVRRPAGWVIFLQKGLLGVAVSLSVIGYGLFRLWRWPALWFSRSRLFYADRVAVEVTGNPNGLTRALLKVAIGIAEEIQQQQQTSDLLESWECLMPLGYRVAISLGSASAHIPLPSLLQWSRSHPYRHWLAINAPHPPVGDRLQRLAHYAQAWRLDSELPWEQGPPASKDRSLRAVIKYIRQNGRLWLQGAPFFGVGLGLVAGLGIWGVGALAWVVDFWQIIWFLGDRGLLIGCLPIGFGIGTLVRINPLFPDLPQTAFPPVSNPDLTSLLTSSTTLPIDSPPVQWQGKLLGRKGISNWLGQDLLLQTSQGLVKLHVNSALGPAGMLLNRAGVRPVTLVQRPVTVRGWGRTGVTPWVDVETIRSQIGKISYSNHPIGSTLVACLAISWGLYIIWHQAGRYPW